MAMQGAHPEEHSSSPKAHVFTLDPKGKGGQDLESG